MREIKNAAPDVRSIESGKGNMYQPTDIHTRANYNGNAANVQAKTVAQFLKQGAENAISTSELLRLLECGSVRQLRQMVEEEREQGSLILSSTSGGDYLPAEGQRGRDEIQRYLATMCARATAIIKATKPARDALRTLDGQINMEGGR